MKLPKPSNLSTQQRVGIVTALVGLGFVGYSGGLLGLAGLGISMLGIYISRLRQEAPK